MSEKITRATDISNAEFREWYVQALAEGITWRTFLLRHNITAEVGKGHYNALCRLSPEMAELKLPTKAPVTARKKASASQLDPRYAKIRTGFSSKDEVDAFIARAKAAKAGKLGAPQAA